MILLFIALHSVAHQNERPFLPRSILKLHIYFLGYVTVQIKHKRNSIFAIWKHEMKNLQQNETKEKKKERGTEIKKYVYV